MERGQHPYGALVTLKFVLIQLILIAAVLGVSYRLLRSSGMRALALRRVGLVALAVFAVITIMFPTTWTALALAVGVGRGTDLLLYALVVAFISYTGTSYVRFRQLELSYTRLARRLALDEAAAATEQNDDEKDLTSSSPDSPRELP